MTITSPMTTPSTTTSREPDEAPPFDRFVDDGPATPAGCADGNVISTALERALAGRTTRVTICGATGTGRTRVIEEARADAVRRGMRVLATHGRAADADVPYGALMTLLHPVADRIGDLPTCERESLQAAIELREQDVDERAARTGLWRLLTRLSEDRPLLITADDSDDMDPASLTVLAFALGRMDSQAVAALTAASGHSTSNPLVTIGDELLVLDGLDVETLAAAVQAAVPATDWVVRRMASFAGGNSAVAIELVRSLSPDQRAGRAACPNVPAPPAHVALAAAPLLEALSAETRTALAVIAADTSDDVAVVRGALHMLGQSGDALAELERAGLVSIAGASLRVRRPMLEVVAYDRLDPSGRRSVHRALAASMSGPQHEPARAWQLAGGSDGPDANVALAMTAVARTSADRGNLRRAAVAYQRAADFADGHDDRVRSLVRSLACWTALGDPGGMRQLMTDGTDGGATIHMARSAAVRWLDGDAAAVAELRTAAPLATSGQRALLDALFADAAFACGHAREAMETARRVVRGWSRGVARNLADALLVLGGQLAPSAMAPLEVAGDDDAAEIVRSRAVLRHAEAHLRFGDGDAAERVLSDAGEPGPLLWDPAERTALRARLMAAQGHPAAARQLVRAAIEALPASASIARAVLRAALAEAQFLLGDGEQAMTDLDDIAPVFHAAAMARLEASSRLTVGRIAWSVGEVDVAVSCMERARRVDPLAPVGDLVALLASLGRDDDARAWLAKIDSRPGEAIAPIDVLRARANVGWEPAGFHQVADVVHRAQLVVPEIELLIDLATWHHRRARWADVYEAAERAARLIVPSGIKAWIERLDRLEPPNGSPAGEVPEALAPLTEAERRVALAVSRGLTNKEAAAELFVSVKTIDSHLQRIYPKLFVRSRGELAVLVNAALVASGAALGQPTGNPPDARR